MPHPEKCSKEDVINRGLLSATAPSVEHQSTHTGPWNHCGWGHTRPCQSTEFQQIRALWQDLAGLNRLNRFLNAKCLQNKDKQKSFGWIFNTVWKRSWEGQLFPNELTGRSRSGRFWYENQPQIWAKTLKHHIGRFWFSWPQQETQNACFKHSLSIYTSLGFNLLLPLLLPLKK